MQRGLGAEERQRNAIHPHQLDYLISVTLTLVTASSDLCPHSSDVLSVRVTFLNGGRTGPMPQFWRISRLNQEENLPQWSKDRPQARVLENRLNLDEKTLLANKQAQESMQS